MSDKIIVSPKASEELVVAQQEGSLARLFQIKPKPLELVSKSTQQAGATPGKFRVTTTNQHFDEMRIVMLRAPQEQRELYVKGKFSHESKLCFSLNNAQPHPRAKQPPALYCRMCPKGDICWEAYREAKQKGIAGDDLSRLQPPCRKFWHLMIAERNSLAPYYFNIKGSSVRVFERAMQDNVAEILRLMSLKLKEENKVRVVQGQEPLLMPSVNDVIYRIVFTIYPWQKAGGPFMVGFKDFAVLSEEDSADFSALVKELIEWRKTAQGQAEEAAAIAEAEQEITEEPASSTPVDLPAANSQIVI